MTLAIAATAAATYSSANGLLLWPLLIAAAALSGVCRRDVLVIAISGAITVGLFFVGYRFTGHDGLQILRNPLHAAGPGG